MVKFMENAFVIEFDSSSPVEEYVILTKSLLGAIKCLPEGWETERYWLTTLLELMLLREEQISGAYDMEVKDSCDG